jgi:tetratricopeptide (TPR) repeat protein
MLQSEDGTLEYLFTDASGRFFLRRLNPAGRYTLMVPGVEGQFMTTLLDFYPSLDGELRVELRSPPRKEAIAAGAASVGSFYVPDARAAKLHRQALEALSKNQWGAAEARLRDAVAADEKFAAPWNDLAVLSMRQQDFAKGEAMLERALQADPKFPLALLNMGITRVQLRKYAQAVSPLRDVVRLDARLATAQLHLGAALVETGEYAEAERCLLQAQELLAGRSVLDAARTQLYLGKLYSLTGAFAKSLEHFEEYLKLVPQAANAAEVRRVMGIMRAEMEKSRR